jgi:hypothetical protein
LSCVQFSQSLEAVKRQTPETPFRPILSTFQSKRNVLHIIYVITYDFETEPLLCTVEDGHLQLWVGVHRPANIFTIWVGKTGFSHSVGGL